MNLVINWINILLLLQVVKNEKYADFYSGLIINLCFIHVAQKFQ